MAPKIAEALRGRGVGEPDASLAAEAAIAVFRNASARRVDEFEQRAYGVIVNQSLARLRTLVGGR